MSISSGTRAPGSSDAPKDPNDDDDDDDKGGLSGGAIAGIVLGLIAAIFAAVFMAVKYSNRGRVPNRLAGVRVHPSAPPRNPNFQGASTF